MAHPIIELEGGNPQGIWQTCPKVQHCCKLQNLGIKPHKSGRVKPELMRL